MSEVLRVNVGLGERAYDVLVGAGALAAAGPELVPHFPRGRAILVTDRHVAALHLEAVSDTLAAQGLRVDPVIVEPGETSKSWTGLAGVVDALLDRNVERSEAVIALGGGVIGDLTGFAAAVTKRGVDFIQIPTTLLAQVDSSVGGKTGINTTHGKNFAGAFHQPRLVIADRDLLATLPDRERRAGYAEIVKAALIGDAAMFDRLEAAGAGVLDGRELDTAVAAAIAFKARIVAEDEREGGVRALLNLGHTFGHAFEADAPKDVIRHGEAVAAGIALAFAYSAQRGDCSATDAARVTAHLRAVGLPATPNELAHTDWNAASLVARMRDDKKNRDGRITLILTRGIGAAFIDAAADEADLLAFMETQLS
ncbi:3-dehydroquinate synthase [Maricaulis maris]|uniref:3-dehydroquinate synthase n=1 Tax=Maricaulis maris TaxID=74318 RepID=A0A495DDV1_9PROT|nr:3-dehydroquinate synthase [Maricaulis maris]RKR00518.1 3-dehydroquinate synthase [Maricaulis maris]